MNDVSVSKTTSNSVGWLILLGFAALIVAIVVGVLYVDAQQRQGECESANNSAMLNADPAKPPVLADC